VSWIVAVMPGPVNFHRGAREAGLILDEQYHKPERGFVGGYLIEASAGDPASLPSWFGGWGKPIADLVENYGRLAGAGIAGEDPPQASNRVTLHSTERDQYGLPVPVIQYAMHQNSMAMQRHAINQTTALYESIGGTNIRATDGIQVACHNMGVARMSANSKDGVTNRWGQVHDIPSLRR
jgi:choline dehydrogenase-like flavoprotein